MSEISSFGLVRFEDGSLNCVPFQTHTILARWAGTSRVGGGLTEIRHRVEPLIRVQCTPLGFQRDNLCQQPL
jgi:hypothetical protein